MRYSVIITRETTESTVVIVEAADESEAEDRALELASADYGSGVEWAHDECSGMQSESYATGCDEVEED